MADNSMLDLASSLLNTDGLEETLGTQKISVMDHMNRFQYSTKESDNYVIDMESFSSNGIISNNKQIINANSRITLQRSLSRKGSSASSSPRAALVVSSMPEKALLVSGILDDHSINPQVHHQITINTVANKLNATKEGIFALRGNGFKRPSSSRAIDPKRVLFFFATLSSMGSILLIYLTLSIGKFGHIDFGPR
ncbi:hypothetical protein M5689_002543 [Euphorbia peplus]|nr:hypothetical protein M5689_002543 [Euphorbia peplus]